MILKPEKSLYQIAVHLTLIIVALGGRELATIAVGPLYLYDSLYIVLFLFALSTGKVGSVKGWALFVFIICLTYLVYDVFIKNNPIYYVFRQFAIFGYFFLFYVIVSTYINVKKKSVTHFIKIFSNSSMLVQVVYVVYLLALGKFEPGGFNYFSPGIIIGCILFVAYHLVYGKKKIFTLVIVVAGILVAALSVGHSSFALSVIIMVGVYLARKIKKNQRQAIIFSFFMCIVSVFYMFDGLMDVNAIWRLVYWKEAILRTWENGLLLLGNGFGVPYASEKTYLAIYKQTGFVNDLLNKEERFFKAFHNSFITMLFHVGIVPLVLLIMPVIKRANTNALYDKECHMLFISLVGLTVWAFFNVILELPYSAVYYWFIFILFVLSPMPNNVEK